MPAAPGRLPGLKGLSAGFFAAWIGALCFVASTGVAAPANAATLDQHTLDKRTGAVLKDLKLGDAAKEAQVRAILEPHFQALQVWHQEKDPALRALWAQWAEARTTGHKDETKAAAVAAEIDATYGSFGPQHDAFLGALGKVLTPEQVEGVKDSLTKAPGLKRTYDAYLQIVPALTAAQKDFILGKLRMAREQAMDATASREKADLFKKQKVQIEAFIDAQGYDWKKSYAAFVAKLNAESAKAKTAPKN